MWPKSRRARIPFVHDSRLHRLHWARPFAAPPQSGVIHRGPRVRGLSCNGPDQDRRPNRHWARKRRGSRVPGPRDVTEESSRIFRRGCAGAPPTTSHRPPWRPPPGAARPTHAARRGAAPHAAPTVPRGSRRDRARGSQTRAAMAQSRSHASSRRSSQVKNWPSSFMSPPCTRGTASTGDRHWGCGQRRRGQAGRAWPTGQLLAHPRTPRRSRYRVSAVEGFQRTTVA